MVEEGLQGSSSVRMKSWSQQKKRGKGDLTTHVFDWDV